MSQHALCIGINNYPGTHMDLAGCVNDANDWAAELAGRGFVVSKLLDRDATKAAMVAAMHQVIAGAKRGDTVVITFSGHGTYVPDLDGDEVDGLDEALCPHDVETAGEALTDDELHALFSTRAAGVKLVLISDSCHSGTVSRAAVAQPEDDEGVPRPRFLPMGNWLPAERLPRGASGRPLANVPGVAGGSPFGKVLLKASGDLLMSGCQEGPNNYSYDARFRGRSNGAFTYFALKVLHTLPANATYADWHAELGAYLPSASYPQAPQLVGSKTARNRRIFG